MRAQHTARRDSSAPAAAQIPAALWTPGLPKDTKTPRRWALTLSATRAARRDSSIARRLQASGKHHLTHTQRTPATPRWPNTVDGRTATPRRHHVLRHGDAPRDEDLAAVAVATQRHCDQTLRADRRPRQTPTTDAQLHDVKRDEAAVEGPRGAAGRRVAQINDADISALKSE